MQIIRFTILLFAVFFCQRALSADEALLEPKETVVLTVSGAIQHSNVRGKALFDWPMLHSLVKQTLSTDTSVTNGQQQFTGFLLRDLLQKVGAKGKHVTAIALNDYQVTIPIEDFQQFDVLAAYQMNGIRLKASDKGPLWIVYPRSDHNQLRDIRYDYRWVWQLVELRIEH